MNGENKNTNIEAGDNLIDYRRLTREERVELLKQTHNNMDNIGETLQRCIEASKEVFNERIVTPEGTEIEDYRILRSAWTSGAQKRYPHIAKHVDSDKEIIDLLLDEEHRFFECKEIQDSVIVTIKNGLRGSFVVDNGENQVLVTDIPSAVKAIKFFDKTYKQKNRDPPIYNPPKYHCWYEEEEDDDPY